MILNLKVLEKQENYPKKPTALCKQLEDIKLQKAHPFYGTVTVFIIKYQSFLLIWKV